MIVVSLISRYLFSVTTVGITVDFVSINQVTFDS